MVASGKTRGEIVRHQRRTARESYTSDEGVFYYYINTKRYCILKHVHCFTDKVYMWRIVDLSRLGQLNYFSMRKVCVNIGQGYSHKVCCGWLNKTSMAMHSLKVC